ncbi:hypothetical protein [Thiospirillum jenense]|uniref:Uncharacterized protein n=1 Tax=Thiospirillum jenense TaxID=1653858 RepID=A0A839HLB4_9GAMM|nr:hypothetical protein [Thiospirillum jenense]MBB1127257.1 hypothetical protein [Thiospirillum jenense]
MTQFDSIIEEIHQTREKISERFGGNIAAIAEDAAQRQAASSRLIWKTNAPNKSRQPINRVYLSDAG